MQETAVTQVAFPALTPGCAGADERCQTHSPLSFNCCGACVSVCVCAGVGVGGGGLGAVKSESDHV